MIAIDFGTSRIKLSYYDPSRAQSRLMELGMDKPFVPALFYLGPDGERAYGVEAAELLDGAEVYPSGAFAAAEVLSVLERLGMRSTITRSAVLQRARSVEALLNAAEPEAAGRRARLVLRHVDMHAPSLLVDPDVNGLTKPVRFSV